MFVQIIQSIYQLNTMSTNQYISFVERNGIQEPITNPYSSLVKIPHGKSVPKFLHYKVAAHLHNSTPDPYADLKDLSFNELTKMSKTFAYLKLVLINLHSFKRVKLSALEPIEHRRQINAIHYTIYNQHIAEDRAFVEIIHRFACEDFLPIEFVDPPTVTRYRLNGMLPLNRFSHKLDYDMIKDDNTRNKNPYVLGCFKNKDIFFTGEKLLAANKEMFKFPYKGKRRPTTRMRVELLKFMFLTFQRQHCIEEKTNTCEMEDFAVLWYRYILARSFSYDWNANFDLYFQDITTTHAKNYGIASMICQVTLGGKAGVNTRVSEFMRYNPTMFASTYQAMLESERKTLSDTLKRPNQKKTQRIKNTFFSKAVYPILPTPLPVIKEEEEVKEPEPIMFKENINFTDDISFDKNDWLWLEEEVSHVTKSSNSLFNLDAYMRPTEKRQLIDDLDWIEINDGIQYLAGAQEFDENSVLEKLFDDGTLPMVEGGETNNKKRDRIYTSNTNISFCSDSSSESDINIHSPKQKRRRSPRFLSKANGAMCGM